jgi:hypothetical protein
MSSNLKNRLLILLLAWMPLSGLAQISFLQSFTYSGTFTRLENGDFRFFLMDVPSAECRVYHPDFRLDKQIRLDVPANYWLSDIKYLSRNLFNSDDKLELLYIAYEYVETASSYYYIYTTRIANEDGQVLLDPVPYPNPTSDHLNVPLPLHWKVNRATLLIRNEMGQIVFQESIEGPVGEVDIQSFGLPAGTYYYQLVSPFYQTKPQKIIHANH